MKSNQSKLSALYQYNEIHGFTWLMRILVIFLGIVQTWGAIISQAMNEDGINYLDIGDAFMRGDWETAISSVWSPVYALILGVVMKIVDPSMHWEFPVIHLVNFVIYLTALLCFEFFWRQVMQYQEISASGTQGKRFINLPDWAWLILGYLLFIFATLLQINIWSVTPDMLMAASVFLASGIILRIRLGNDGWHNFLILGCTLGFGFLIKTIMFPLSIAVLGLALFSVGDIKRAVPRVFAALIVFLLISGPFIALLSLDKGEFTFGEAGTLTYARYLNGVPYPHWQGDPPKNGMPEHPTRKVFDQPPIYEFGTPIEGTYPVSLNPAYWYEGVEVHFDLERQLEYLSFSALFYFDLFFHQQAGLIFGISLLYVMSHRKKIQLTEVINRWGLAILALFAFSSYGLVNVLGRYVGVFVVLFWADMMANVRLPGSLTNRRITKTLSIIMVILMLVNIVAFSLENVRSVIGWGNPHQQDVSQVKSPSWPGEVAEKLHALGIRPGDKVAIIGYGFGAFWARLARVQIVAEMLDWQADDFWLGDSTLQSEVLQTFASTVADAIVAENVPAYANLRGWHQVGNSDYYVYLLTE